MLLAAGVTVSDLRSLICQARWRMPRSGLRPRGATGASPPGEFGFSSGNLLRSGQACDDVPRGARHGGEFGPPAQVCSVAVPRDEPAALVKPSWDRACADTTLEGAA